MRLKLCSTAREALTWRFGTLVGGEQVDGLRFSQN
jgi:hypothetical protein